jgi:hypothetical protein
MEEIDNAVKNFQEKHGKTKLRGIAIGKKQFESLLADPNIGPQIQSSSTPVFVSFHGISLEILPVPTYDFCQVVLPTKMYTQIPVPKDTKAIDQTIPNSLKISEEAQAVLNKIASTTAVKTPSEIIVGMDTLIATLVGKIDQMWNETVPKVKWIPKKTDK